MNSLHIAVSNVYALICMAPACMKLLGTTPMRAAAEHFGIPWARYRIIGVLELAAVAGVLAGIYCSPRNGCPARWGADLSQPRTRQVRRARPGRSVPGRDRGLPGSAEAYPMTPDAPSTH